MSRAAALIWILIALILGLAVWFTTPRAVLPSASAQFLPDFSPAQVAKVEIAWPGGESARLTRSDSRWILQAQSPNVAAHAGAEFPPWPVDSNRVQGLLRLIAEAHDGGNTQAMPAAIFLTVHRESGDPIRLAIDPNTLGGTGRIARLTSDGRVQAVASISEQFVRALDATSIDSWRSKDLLFWPPEATSAFDSHAGPSTLELAKSGGAWIMHAPIAVKADAGTVEGVLLLLSKSGIDRFLPANALNDNAWKEPVRTIRLASRSNAAPTRRDIEQTIEIGPAIDASSRAVRVTARDLAADTILWGPEIAILNNATLEAIPSVPSAFISRRTLDRPAADIASIEIESSGQRTIVKRTQSGNFGEADAPTRELLRLLAETPASQIKILEPPPQPNPSTPDSITIRVLGPKAEPLGEFTLRSTTIASSVTGAPAVPGIESTDRSVARFLPWQRPADFLATLRAIKSQ